MGGKINMENLSRLTVQIRKDQHKKLKDKAGPGVSISYLVRHAIDSTDIAPYSRVSFDQSAVMPSSLDTQRKTIGQE